MDLNELKEFLENLKQDEISFDPHFYKRVTERPVNEGIVRSYFSSFEKLEKAEVGKGENRFKLWFKMSRKYSLVVIVEIHSKSLKVISAWNSDRKWQNKLKQ